MTRPPLVLVAALGRNGAIGRHNGLPWRLAGDMRHFRRLTMGKPLILGRRTWDSIGRPLPGRTLVVVSRDPALSVPDGVTLCRDPFDALRRARAVATEHGAGTVMVGGGAALYASLIDSADRLEITEVDLEPAADTFFPLIDPTLWRELCRQPQPQGEADDARYDFVTFGRR